MTAAQVTTITIPVNGRSGVAFEAGQSKPPVLAIMTVRPGLLVTLALPEEVGPGEARFARDLATTAAMYAAEVERRTKVPSASPPG